MINAFLVNTTSIHETSAVKIKGIFKNVIGFLGYPAMICSPLLAKQYFPRQRQLAFTD